MQAPVAMVGSGSIIREEPTIDPKQSPQVWPWRSETDTTSPISGPEVLTCLVTRVVETIT